MQAPLTPSQIQTLLQTTTISVMGYSDPVKAPSLVRIDWPTEGQPAWGISDDIIFVRAVEDDDAYNRNREVVLRPSEGYGQGGFGSGGYGGNAIIGSVTYYPRIWMCDWTLYGPNSFDNARKIKSSLFTQSVHDMFAAQSLYLVTDVSAARRTPELFAAQWWERVDFSARFNELVAEADVVQTVKSTEVKVYTFHAPDIDHPDRDIVVTGN